MDVAGRSMDGRFAAPIAREATLSGHIVENRGASRDRGSDLYKDFILSGDE
jgi:hypothetical protein